MRIIILIIIIITIATIITIIMRDRKQFVVCWKDKLTRDERACSISNIRLYSTEINFTLRRAENFHTDFIFKSLSDREWKEFSNFLLSQSCTCA